MRDQQKPHREPTTAGLALFVIGGIVSVVAFFVCIAGALWYHSLDNPVTSPSFGVLVASEVLWVGALVFGVESKGGDE